MANDWEINGQEAERNIRTYFECQRWLNAGPLRQDLTRNQREYILFIGAYPNIRPTLMSFVKVLKEKAGTVSGVIGSLEEQGLVKITQDTEDERKKHFELTELGLKEYKNLCLYVHGNSTMSPVEQSVDPF